jgi:hypothetical protein
VVSISLLPLVCVWPDLKRFPRFSHRIHHPSFSRENFFATPLCGCRNAAAGDVPRILIFSLAIARFFFVGPLQKGRQAELESRSDTLDKR